METVRTTIGEAATELILSTFRARGLLIEAGDRLGAKHGLTSARWQVLGAIALAERPLTVSQIARRMGLTRQSVHATVDRLVRDGLLEFARNDDHRRSPLVRLTDLGDRTYRAVDRDQARWIDELVRGMTRTELDTSRRVLDELVSRLEARRSEAERSRELTEAGVKAR
jgi:DNA-binding MarR family transcriptional regulator